jgi:hypothetical protein
MTSIDDCKIINLPKISDPTKGNLTFVEENRHIPFDMKRVYYLYDVPGGEDRGEHAHRELEQFIIAMSGSFDIMLDDGHQKKKFHMNRAHYGLYLCPMIWRRLDNFSSGAVCLVLASDFYKESDYIRKYDDFIEAVKERGTGGKS